MAFYRSLLVIALALFAGMLSPCAARAITIDIRYDLDNNGYFTANPQAKEALEFAARAFEPFADNLTAIDPDEQPWTATFFHPATGAAGSSIANLLVPEDTLIIYAGARDLPNQLIGQGSPGSGPSALLSRGQAATTGPAANDFGLWGGTIAFDTQFEGETRNWHFDQNTSPAPGQIDFLSVATHELAHVLGFGFTAADSFQNLIESGFFLGEAAVALYGSDVPLDGTTHWAQNTTSPPFANEPKTALDPVITFGQRRMMTPLDFAGLKDIGWEVPDQLLGLPGNLDGDDDVDGADLLAWQRGFGQTGGGPPQLGDASGDAIVDDYDLWLWQRNFGARAASPAELSAAQVPEPATETLFFASLLLQLIQRRRR